MIRRELREPARLLLQRERRSNRVVVGELGAEVGVLDRASNARRAVLGGGDDLDSLGIETSRLGPADRNNRATSSPWDVSDRAS